MSSMTHDMTEFKGAAEVAERRALWVSVIGNLGMGLAGMATFILSNSQAILVDGLLALIGSAAALVALRVSLNVLRKPDRARPFGYGADESIFTTFRALTMLGLVLFASVNAIGEIVGHLSGETPTELYHRPIVVYVVLMLVCVTILWVFHYTAWRQSERTSDILKLEANATLFDGVITVATGAGLLLIWYFEDGILAPIAPIGDSLVVLVLCFIAVFVYLSDFRQGLAELAGVSAAERRQDIARQVITQALTEKEGLLLELAMTKNGRSFSVVAFVDPQRSISGQEVNKWTDDISVRLVQALGRVDAMIVICAEDDP